MSTYQDAKELSNLALGKTTSYCSQYNPELLQAVPRTLNRNSLGLNSQSLPFNGEDVWYGYELSWLNARGKPVVAVAEFRVPCTSPAIIESKSFKLYLNSFNQSQFESQQHVQELLANDLSKVANAPVSVSLFKVDHCPALSISSSSATCIDEEDIEVTSYDYDPSLLSTKEQDTEQSSKQDIEEHLVSHLLKSNCLITNQPDWASVYIKYTGKAINHAKLLAYIVSFREHNEFHEQCVERIYCDIKKFCDVSSLEVFARYTRRGGLDINPFRSSTPLSAPNARTLRQ